MMRLPHSHAALLLSFLPLLATSAAAGAAPPDVPGSYWGIHGGQNDLKRLDARAAYASGATYTGRADLAHGSHVGVQLGRRGPHMRHEIEFEAGDFRVRHLAVGPVRADLDAHGHYQAAFANGYYTGQPGEALEIFAGAGIGWGRTSLPRLRLKSACTCFGAASKAGFAWQVRAGVAYRLSQQSDLSLLYTRLRLPGAETDGPPAVRYGRAEFGAWSLGWTSRF